MTQWLFYCIASDNKSNDNTAIMTLGKTEENFILENSIKNQSILYLYTVAHTHTHAYTYVHMRTHTYSNVYTQSQRINEFALVGYFNDFINSECSFMIVW